MSDATDKLISIAAEVGKQVLGRAIEWGIGKLREEARERGVPVPNDDAALQDLLTAQLEVNLTAMSMMKMSIDADIEKLNEADRKFRTSPNVTVVDDMGEPTELPAAGETGEMEPLK